MEQQQTEKFDFLAKLALKEGAVDAKIIPAHKIVIEDRVVLKCKVGCNHYGETLACPPYTPTAEHFRKIVAEYSYAEPEVYKYLMTYQTDTSIPKYIKEKAAKFWQDWKDSKRRMLQTVVDLEKAAMRQGYTLAMSFISGHCQLCEKCNTETKVCRHPELMRMSEDAIGVNVKKTAANSGITFTFPFSKSADSFALLLIE
jgi:predicted metal-binding protein